MDDDFIGEPDQAAATLTLAQEFTGAVPKLRRRYAVVVEQDLWPFTLDQQRQDFEKRIILAVLDAEQIQIAQLSRELFGIVDWAQVRRKGGVQISSRFNVNANVSAALAEEGSLGSDLIADGIAG